MRIVIPCSGYGRIYRGIETWTHFLAKELAKMNLEVFILCGKDVFVSSEKKVKLLKFPIIKREKLVYKKRPFEEISSLIEVTSLSVFSLPYLLNLKFDVIIASSWSDLYSLLLLKKAKKIKSLFCFHSCPRKLTKILYIPLLFSKIERVISVSNFVKMNVKKILGIDSEVIYNGVDTKFFRPLTSEEKNRVSLLYVGTWLKKKGIYTLINAVKELDDKYFELLIVGHGPEEKNIRNLVNGFPNIKIIGKVSSKKLVKIYNYSDIVIIPSEYPEALSIVALEAMACGKPIIASKIGGLGEIVKKSKSGLLFEPKDKEDLVEKILALSRNNKLRKKLGTNGRKFAENELSWNKVAKKYLEIIQGIK